MCGLFFIRSVFDTIFGILSSETAADHRWPADHSLINTGISCRRQLTRRVPPGWGLDGQLATTNRYVTQR
jgi:hypothetical protein